MANRPKFIASIDKMIKKMVKEWLRFCNGDTESFEDSYFYTLFMEGVTEIEIEEIFSTFPNSLELVKRTKQFLNTKANSKSSKEILQDLIKNDFEERMPILRQLSNFSNFVSDPIIRYTDDTELVSNLILDDIWVQEFHDFMRTKMIITERKVYELYNAFYGLTYDFDYQLYLFQPLLRTDYQMNYLFDFKKQGGIYAITEKEVVFSIKK
jgi:hypothetical protein